jgi:hypothetical protein
MRALMLAAVILTLTGCATTTGSGVRTNEASCRAFQPIYWSAEDTDETIRAAKAHNAVGVKLCGWKGGR